MTTPLLQVCLLLLKSLDALGQLHISKLAYKLCSVRHRWHDSYIDSLCLITVLSLYRMSLWAVVIRLGCTQQVVMLNIDLPTFGEQKIGSKTFDHQVIYSDLSKLSIRSCLVALNFYRQFIWDAQNALSFIQYNACLEQIEGPRAVWSPDIRYVCYHCI